MKWSALFKKLGNQPMSITNNKDVYAMIRDPNTGNLEKHLLRLQFDKNGHPYFAEASHAIVTHQSDTSHKI